MQAFEVSGHLGNGPATDPYTDDVARGMARMFASLTNQTNVSQTYEYNPAAVNYTCSNGVPTTANPTYPYCGTGHAGLLQCQCYFLHQPTLRLTFDGNKNGQMIYSNDNSGEYIYTTGPFIDALVASANSYWHRSVGSCGRRRSSGYYGSNLQECRSGHGRTGMAPANTSGTTIIGNPGYAAYYRG